jgi:hypothetical protein
LELELGSEEVTGSGAEERIRKQYHVTGQVDEVTTAVKRET